MNRSLPGYSVHGILQARILKWVAIPFSRGSSWPRDQTLVFCIVGRFFTIWAPGKPIYKPICLLFSLFFISSCVVELLLVSFLWSTATPSPPLFLCTIISISLLLLYYMFICYMTCNIILYLLLYTVLLNCLRKYKNYTYTVSFSYLHNYLFQRYFFMWI